MEWLAYDFMQRALLAGVLVAFTCPVIGAFLVARRQSVIGDGLGHIAFAGVAAGWLLGWQPVASAALFTVLGAAAMEWVRKRNTDWPDLVLAIFFYSSMALAVILASMKQAGGLNLSSFLFGSLITVDAADLWLMGALGGIVWLVVSALYRPLVYLSFDETAARVSGLPTNTLNYLLAVLTALTVAVAMRIVGILLVAALMVIPVACALPGANGFRSLIARSVAYALAAVVVGLSGAYYGNFAPGGCIVLAATGLFVVRSLPAWR